MNSTLKNKFYIDVPIINVGKVLTLADVCIYTFFFLFFVNTVFAQKNFTLQIMSKDSLPFRQQKIPFISLHEDSLSANIFLKTTILQFRQNGYWEVSVDSSSYHKNKRIAYIYLGNPYELLTLKNTNISNFFLEKLSFQHLFAQKWTYQQIINIKKELLTVAENNGYPFAIVGLDSFFLVGTHPYANLILTKNALITIDDIDIEGEMPISKNFLWQYLNLKKGEVYNEEKIKNIAKKMERLTFLKLKNNFSVRFEGNSAKLIFSLEKQKNSRWDALIGVQPNNDSYNTRSRLVVTGMLNLDLQNTLEKGERIIAEFQRLRPLTQQLRVQANYPYPFRLPVTVEGRFEIYKKDSTYTDVTSFFAINYNIENNLHLKGFRSNTNSILQSIDTLAIKQTHQLPSALDTQHSIYGLSLDYQNLDYAPNPRSGWDILLKIGAGTKIIKKNNLINNIKDNQFIFSSLYDNIPLKSNIFTLELRIEKYFYLSARSTLKTSVKANSLFSNYSFLQNEQFRVGGNRLLRGFDEDAFLALRYLVGSIEYRYLLARNSYFYTFLDNGYLENVTSVLSKPIGIGAGISFETKAGIFGIGYALGKQSNTPFDIKAAKIHFGYLSLF